MLTGVVLTRNEQENLGKCLNSLKFCDAILIIDDNSTDDTVKIAQEAGAKVITHALNADFAAQRNFALSQVSSDWVLFVDADEVVSSDLASEIKRRILKGDSFSGFSVHRVDFLWGKQFKHGDVGNIKLLRLARRQAGEWQGKVHETWQVKGPTSELKNPLYHYPHANLTAFLQRINLYSTIRASELKSQNHKTSIFEIIFYPIGKFLKLWIWDLGFADGTTGFIHAMTMAFYSFLVRGKLWLSYY